MDSARRHPNVFSTVQTPRRCHTRCAACGGAVVDGPLGFDNAVSLVAARQQGLNSAVAGQADILLVPDLESGNMLAEQLERFSDAISGGVVVGAQVPIVLAQRSDSPSSRLAACVLALLVANANRQTEPD